MTWEEGDRCPMCDGQRLVNVGRTGHPPVMIPCSHPCHKDEEPWD